ncbi:hypothetical protein SARC_00280 [Sphaeroforma arctica JP610]|uniref:Cystinosin n=1 Tax=Sphaeroforma arctica JP610 TaxID=667725 RepID=A0A0L0GGY1_9EUKA|nr:hypothetical protein SARC_00280 [Sphaeroforma arctica JP610]KNC87578.1 hypothetical protein SARC_00280 [Sphaeroforma arctica JP610]|eukprot:XP_014161480.1 hypothetical protein SARC_00280 [Sphaeroforma arctica JP610]
MHITKLLFVASLPWLAHPRETNGDISTQPSLESTNGQNTYPLTNNSTESIPERLQALSDGVDRNNGTQIYEDRPTQATVTMVTLDSSESGNMSQTNETMSKVMVVNSLQMVQYISMLGWLCFVLWSLSFYPQVLENMKRQSVTGLNIDGVVYNLTGFLSYALFNVGMYYSETVQQQYFTIHQTSTLPVTVSDVAFAVHASIMTGIVLLQVHHYRTPDQTLSHSAKVINGCMWASAVVLLIAVKMDLMAILSYLQAFSSLKLMLTVVKYIPQVMFNFQRKSTAGFSVGTQLFDIFGGVASVLQMFLQASNTNDWSGLTGNPTKTGLAMVSIGFDLVLIIQHYYYTYYRSSAEQPKDTMPISMNGEKKNKYGALDVPVSNLTEVVHHTTEFSSFFRPSRAL